jgi:uncharacterized metal-binding protein YceD (DUF177 family)
MSGAPPTKTQLRVADLAADRAAPFALHPSPEARAALAEALGLPAIRKLRFEGTLAPVGARDWALKGMLGATVVQDCVATLAPVTTRIDEPVTRLYLADAAPLPGGEEVEMLEDDSQEPLPEIIDLALVMEEALALALPAYPRADGAEIGTATAAPKGATPLDEAEVKPFAGLAALRDKLADPDGA